MIHLYHQNWAIICLPAKYHLNAASLGFFDEGPTLNAGLAAL